MLHFESDSSSRTALPQTPREPGPERQRQRERPDNGSRGSRGAGPSSGVRRDNPHLELRSGRHAR
jgi:hypothetical protein